MGCTQPHPNPCRKAENASDPDVKARASKTLPKMRQHLERAKSIKDSLDRAGDQQ